MSLRNKRRSGTFGLIIAFVLAGMAIFRYCTQTEYNPITGEEQHVGNITVDQEIRLGLESTPTVVQQHRGMHPDREAQALVDRVGARLVESSAARETNYQYEFHLLADPKVVNAFALPGGQVFVTYALFSQLESEDQLAGILGHEVGHVVARHGAERIAKQQLSQGLTGAAVIAGGDFKSAQAAVMISKLVNMKYGRDQELESDDLGVRFMIDAGYNPYAFLDVMAILERSAGGASPPEFLSTHPSNEHRVEQIKAAIQKYGYTEAVQ